MSTIVHDSQYVASGHQQLTIADTPVSLLVSYLGSIQKFSTVTGKTDTKISASKILLSPIDYPFYYTLDGTAPGVDGATGHPCPVGSSLEIKGWRNISNFKMVRQGSSSAKVNMTVFFNEPGV